MSPEIHAHKNPVLCKGENMGITSQAIVIILLLATPASADTLSRLVYSKCQNGLLIMALTSKVNYEPTEADRAKGVRTLSEFAHEGGVSCQSGAGMFSINVAAYYPDRARGMCGAQDSAKLRVVETLNGSVVHEAWIVKSHGWSCINSNLIDRQIRLGKDIFALCSRPNELDRDPTLLDITGFDCIQLVERD